jgi:hypothetical protein
MARNFADEIGRGGYGSMFKGHIVDTVVAAVKRLDNVSTHETEFMNEVDSVGYIHHKNLANLQGYCVKDNRGKMLVYTSTWSMAPLTGHYLEHLIPKVLQILIPTNHPFLSGGLRFLDCSGHCERPRVLTCTQKSEVRVSSIATSSLKPSFCWTRLL